MYLIIGVGQCGCSLVDALHSYAEKELRKLYKPIAINTTFADLMRLKKIRRESWLGIGENGNVLDGRVKGFGGQITGGIGANFSKGCEVFREAREGIMEQLEKLAGEKIALSIIFYGLGGGTGSSGAPIVAESLTEEGIPTIGIGVLPADSEGDIRSRNAYTSLKYSLNSMDGVLIADNNIIYNPKKGLSSMFNTFNSYVAGCMSDFIFGPFIAGAKLKQEGLTFDYKDFISSLNIGNEKGIGVFGRYTQSLGFFSLDEKFGMTSIEVGKRVIEVLENRLSVRIEKNREGIYKLACVSTLHPSIKEVYPYGELQSFLDNLAKIKVKGVYVGTNETRKRMIRITLSITYDPEYIERLWAVKNGKRRCEGWEEEILKEKEKKREERGGEKLFE